MLNSIYFHRTFYYLGLGTAGMFVLGYFFPPLIFITKMAIVCIGIAVVADVLLLFRIREGLAAMRVLPARFSNGDENKIIIGITNRYSFGVHLLVIDELPYQFQERSWHRTLSLRAGGGGQVPYALTPKERGEYHFGNVIIFTKSALGLVLRRYSFDCQQTVKVYPSYVQMRRYQLLSAANRLQEAGVKRMRKLGHSLEFEQIKEYVPGDDYRTVNWKATARRGGIMTNSYTDERSQQIYCIVNKGRIMKMPFEGLSLLDYAINASLVLANVALMRQDKAGLITFAEAIDTFIPADKKPGQLNTILENLYRQETNFLENDFEKLFSVVRNRITHRSLLVLFTNFESVDALRRELPSLRRIAHYHLLMVIFFENTELTSLTEAPVQTTEDIYIKTIAEKYALEKKLMAKELQQNGIVAVLTTPQNLTINAINKYLELKNRARV